VAEEGRAREKDKKLVDTPYEKQGSLSLSTDTTGSSNPFQCKIKDDSFYRYERNRTISMQPYMHTIDYIIP
jgi:hypothetical protein